MIKKFFLAFLAVCLVFSTVPVLADDETGDVSEAHNIITLSSEYEEVYVGENVKLSAVLSSVDSGINAKTEWKVNGEIVPELSGQIIILQENMQLEFQYFVPPEDEASLMTITLSLYDDEGVIISSGEKELAINEKIPVSIQNTSDKKVYYNQKTTASVKLINKTGRDYNFNSHWELNGHKIKGYENEIISVGDETIASLHTNLSDYKGEKVRIRFVLDNGINSISADIALEVLEYPTEESYLEKVKTMRKIIRTVEIECILVRDSNVYKELYLKNKTAYKKKGSKGIYVNYYGTTSAKVRFPDGTTGWVPYWNISISSTNYTSSKKCPDELKELFANENVYKSETKYLIWISLRFQQVNAYTGEKGRWKLVRSGMPCSSGKNTTPTISGVFKYSQYQTRWNFGEFYVGPVMRFNGGAAMHSRTYKPDGSLLDPTLGRPASHGCVRMKQKDIDWLAKHIPLKTTVVVF